jgi:hypothetical protein
MSYRFSKYASAGLGQRQAQNENASIRTQDDSLDFAAPSLGLEPAHAYEQAGALVCCARCGAGRKHAIHSAVKS